MKVFTISDLSTNYQKELENGLKFAKALQEFQNLAKPSTFNFIFGEEDGTRLWEQFVIKTKRNIFEMLDKNYFSIGQKNTLLANIFMNSITNYSSSPGLLYSH